MSEGKGLLRPERLWDALGILCALLLLVASQAGYGVAIGIAWLGLALWLVGRIARRIPHARYVLLAAFLLRATVALFHEATGALPDSSLDAATFERAAAQWAAEGLASLPGRFVLGAYLYSWLLAVAYALLGHSPLLASGINVLIGTLVVLNVYLASAELWGARKARVAGWLAALWPSLILYSVLTMREVAVVYPATLGALLLVRWARRGGVVHYVGATIAFAVATIFHAGAVVALPILLALPLMRGAWLARRGHWRAALRSAAPTLLAVAALALAAAAASAGGYDLTGRSQISIDLFSAREASAGAARSAYLVWLQADSPLDLAWQAPIRAAYMLFSPMPWMVSLARDVAGVLDGLLYLAILVGLWRGRRRLAGNAGALAVLALVAALLVVFALNTFNAGTALRHRAKLAPLLLVALPPLALAADDARRRLLIVVNDARTFFPSRFALARAARESGYQVEIAAPPGEGFARIQAEGFRAHELPLRRRAVGPWGELRTLLRLVRIYRVARPHVVHHFTIKPVLYGGLAARLARVPACVSTITGLGYVYTRDTARSLALRAIVGLGYSVALDHPNACVVFQNEDDRRAFIEHGLVETERTRRVGGSGVDLARYRPQPEPEGAMTVLLPARLLVDKGIREYVEAGRILRERKAEIRLALAGAPDPGNPASLDAREVEEAARRGDVEWWGEVDDMPAAYRRCHVVCLPSYREGVPRALLEGAASGRALVATDVPGCREVVKHEQNGLLVPPRHALALADALEALARDPGRRRRYGEAARELVERGFAIERVLESTIRTYDALLAAASAHPAAQAPPDVTP